MKNQIEEYKPMVMLLKDILNPGMKQRHWDIIANETSELLYLHICIQILQHFSIIFRNKSYFNTIVDFSKMFKIGRL